MLLSDLATGEQVFLGGQQTAVTAESLLTPPEVAASWGEDCRLSDYTDEGGSEGEKGQTSEQHFYWRVMSCVERAKEGEKGRKNLEEHLDTWLSGASNRLTAPCASLFAGRSSVRPTWPDAPRCLNAVRVRQNPRRYAGTSCDFVFLKAARSGRLADRTKVSLDG